MDKAQFLPAELEALAGRWGESGDVEAIVEAVILCGRNAWPLPEWCVEPLCKALNTYNEAGERGRGTPRTRSATIQRKKIRHDLVKCILASPTDFTGSPTVTVEEAFEEAAKILSKQNVTARAIKESYYEIEGTPEPPI